MNREDGRSPVWGGATAGLLIGLVLGFFLGESYWRTVGISVLVGAALGLATELLAWLGSRMTARTMNEPQEHEETVVIQTHGSGQEILASAFLEEWMDLNEEQRNAIIQIFQRTWEDERTNYPTLQAGLLEFRRIMKGNLRSHADIELRLQKGSSQKS